MIANDLADKYGLTTNMVLGAIEIAVTRVMTKALGNQVITRYDGDELKIVVLHDMSPPREMSVSEIPNKLQRHLMHKITEELIFRKTCFDAERLKSFQGKVVDAELSKVTADGRWVVTINTEYMFKQEQWYAECLPNYIPQHEKGTTPIGTVRRWLVTSVVPISDGSDTRLRWRLSRVSPDLPVALLTESTGIPGITCTKRIPGAYSMIHAPKRLPKDAISHVRAELRENINVKFSG